MFLEKPFTRGIQELRPRVRSRPNLCCGLSRTRNDGTGATMTKLRDRYHVLSFVFLVGIGCGLMPASSARAQIPRYVRGVRILPGGGSAAPRAPSATLSSALRRSDLGSRPRDAA